MKQFKPAFAMPRIPAAVETPSVDAVRRFWPLAVIVALAVAAIYVSLIVSIDNTNLGTTNGLWKTPFVYEWEHRTAQPIENGGLFYFPLYGISARFIPDRLVHFGVDAPILTFRKMAILNAIFGGVASGFVCLLALRFTGSPWAAIFAVVAHSTAGFILLNSINSEDIIPAYTFFIGATVCFFEFLYRRRIWLLLAWAYLFACTTMTHWTVMVPGLIAYGAAFLIPVWRRKSYLVVGIVWVAAFLAFVKLFVSRINVPLWDAIYPRKASTEGWIGFQPQKLIYCAIGIGNYFTGGANISNFRSAFGDPRVVEMMSVSWAFAVLGLAVCIAVLWSKRETPGAKCLAIFALALFAAGELENLYSQPQDPQMQIQPMFGALIGVILLSRKLSFRKGSVALRLGTVGFAAALLANAAVNVREMEAGAGGDSRALAGVEELDRLFPHENTTYVSGGFEGWNTWAYVVLWRGDNDVYYNRSIQLYRTFIVAPGISGEEAARTVRRKIDGDLQSGRRVVAFALWTQSPSDFEDSLATITAPAQAASYDAALRNSYSLGRRGHIGVGDYVELLAAPAK